MEKYIDCYLRESSWFHIRPASSKRPWMDAIPHHHAYKCLPLVHANQHGWEILLKQGFDVEWNGGHHQQDLHFSFMGGFQDGFPPAVSSFGSGIVTFHLPCLFQTPKDINLWVMGVPNQFKDGAQPLSGIIETDWYKESGFTMNWKITRPNTPIRFHQFEAFAFIVPVQRGFVESFQPRLRSFDSNPELKKIYYAAEQRRLEFQSELSIRQKEHCILPGPEQKKEWQNHYYRGCDHQNVQQDTHQTKLHLKPFDIS